MVYHDFPTFSQISPIEMAMNWFFVYPILGRHSFRMDHPKIVSSQAGIAPRL
jgi:hypothetical protein